MDEIYGRGILKLILAGGAGDVGLVVENEGLEVDLVEEGLTQEQVACKEFGVCGSTVVSGSTWKVEQNKGHAFDGGEEGRGGWNGEWHDCDSGTN